MITFMDSKTLVRFHGMFSTEHTGVLDTPCWIWDRACNEKGYAQFWFKEYGQGPSKNHRGHKAAYEHYRGKVQEGMELDHLCGMECCVNPWHLQEVTGQENQYRKWAVIRSFERKQRVYA